VAAVSEVQERVTTFSDNAIAWPHLRARSRLRDFPGLGVVAGRVAVMFVVFFTLRTMIRARASAQIMLVVRRQCTVGFDMAS